MKELCGVNTVTTAKFGVKLIHIVLACGQAYSQ
jgi:hypothetical protein